MPRQNQEARMPPTFKSNISFTNSTILSINESPQSNILSDIRLPSGEPAVGDVAFGEHAVKNININSNEESLNEFCSSVFEYPEWITLVDLNDASGDDNCDNSTKASSKKQPKPGWTCNFCCQTFIDRNATKAICHLAGVTGKNIKTCCGIIPEKDMKVIRARNAIRIRKHENTTKFHKVRNKHMVSQQQSILAGLELMADQSCKGRSRAVLSSFGSNKFGTNTATNYCKKQLD